MTAIWEDFPDECTELFDRVIEDCQRHKRCMFEAYGFLREFTQRPKRHLSVLEAWSEFVKEKDFEAQEGESTESVTTQIEPDPIGDEGEDFEDVRKKYTRKMKHPHNTKMRQMPQMGRDL
ncbi:hypothetical protein A2U01_0039980 [Trifolium medium]|uniref:Uncharacterized protein n=1 Tax=Trifolium medium TaxID=97028 RepID=A0A392Q6E3_9FABA|nr:hypothetical protein [Trifolium medium]